MDQKTCYYCGTKYPIEDECCPLCGQTEIEPEALDETPVEITTEPEVDNSVEERQQRRNKNANLVSTIICIVLAIAVVAGALFILNTLGVLGEFPFIGQDPRTHFHILGFAECYQSGNCNYFCGCGQ